MSAVEVFIPVTKVDVEQRLVYGIATAEREDQRGEICDYESSKPYYEKWSEEIAASTDGKSLGNVRAMHGAIAAGKLTAITFNDELKQIEICAKIIDDAEWLKVCEGVYTGFSQGGFYVRRWTDEDGLKRYTVDPLEISLVDLPCLPQARFEIVKADGSREWREFRVGTVSIKRLAGIVDSIKSLQQEASSGSFEKRTGDAFATQLQALISQAIAILRFGSGTGRENVADAEARREALQANADLPQGQGQAGTPLDPTSDPQIAANLQLGKHFDLIVTKVDDILQCVKNIESQPLPLPFGGGGRPVSKAEDARPDTGAEAELTPAERDAFALLAIKLAQRNGRSFFGR